MTDKTIIAHLIKDWCNKSPERQVLTFVDIGQHGEFKEQTRTYRQLWDNGQNWLCGCAIRV